MQKQKEQELYSSPNCKEAITTYSAGRHKSQHQAINGGFISELLPQYIGQRNKVLQNFFIELKKIMVRLRDSLDKKIANLDQQIQKYNIELQYNLSEQASRSCLWILQKKVSQYSKIRCCNVYEIYHKIFEGEGKPVANNLIQTKIKSIGQIIETQLSESFKQYHSFFEKYRNAPVQNGNESKKQELLNTKSPVNSNISQKKNQSTLMDSGNEGECRPTRGQRPQQRRQMVEKKQQRIGFKKISQLDKLKQNQRFNIKLKILKEMKGFKIRNQTKMKLKVGDETGVAICILSMNPNIKINATIQLTECRVYDFRGLQMQIQSTKHTIVSNADQIKRVNERYNFSRVNKEVQRQMREKRQGERVNQIPRQLRQNRQKRQPRQKVQERGPRRQIRQRRSSRNDRDSQKSQKKEEDDDEFFYNQDQEVDSEREQIIESSKNYGNGFTKINQIQPGLQTINMLAQIFKIIPSDQQDQQSGVLCVIGDQTGIVKALLPKTLSFIKQGHTIKLNSVNVPVIGEHIQIRLSKSSSIEQVPVIFSSIKVDQDMSAQSWVTQEQGDDN